MKINYRNIDDLEIGAFQYQAHTFPMHFHTQYAFALVESGRGDFKIGREDFKAGSGYFTIIHPEEAHTTTIEHDFGLVYKTLYLPPELLNRLVPEIKNHLYFTERLLKHKNLVRLFSSVHHTLLYSPDELELESGLSTFITDLQAFSTIQPKITNPKSHNLKRAIEYLNDNYAEKVTLQDLSKQVHLSPSHFLRLFKKQLGLSPMQYLTSIRVNKAKKLLHQGYPIKDVAFQTGFYDQSHFNKYFKAITGITPIHFKSRG